MQTVSYVRGKIHRHLIAIELDGFLRGVEDDSAVDAIVQMCLELLAKLFLKLTIDVEV